MFGKKKVEALVVGAGPTGLVAALSLVRNGVDIEIIDYARRSCTGSHALIIHPKTLQLFDHLGFVDRIIESGYRVDTMLLYDDTQVRETIKLTELPSNYPFAISLPQNLLESILEDELSRSGAHVLWNHKLTDVVNHRDSLHAEVDRYADRGMGYAVAHFERVVEKTLHYDCKLLVAADGYNSITRQLIGCEQSQLAPPQHYAFFDYETDMDPGHAIRISLQGDLATAQFPLGDGLARLSFQYSGLTLPSENRNKDRELLHPDEASDQQLLDDTTLKDLVNTRVPWVTGYINKIKYQALAPFEKLYLKEPLVGRVFFLGDAARAFGALNMTSMNLGMQEAFRFASAARQELEQGILLTKLETLSQHFTREWETIGAIDNASTPIEMADPWVVENRARILRSIPATGEDLEHLASQIFLHLKLSETVSG